MSLPKYPEYKDSGVSWLGEVPAHWEITRGKNIFDIRKRIAGQLGYSVLSITQSGIKIKDIESNDGQLSMDYSKYQLVYPGDFAMNHMDLLTGFVDISIHQGVTSPDYRVFGLRDVERLVPKYFLYLLQNGYRRKIFYAFGQGASEFGRWRFPTDAFNDFCYPKPSKDEQILIANFLDRETTKIDALIAEQEKLIALLAEKRQATISRAVTRGLDPNVPLKDSGVPWLGKVPAHWDVAPLKYFVKNSSGAIKTGPFGSQLTSSEMEEGPIKVYNQRNVIDRDFYSGDNYISEEKYRILESFTVFPGDVLITTRGTIGKVAILPQDAELGILHPCLLRVQVCPDLVDANFLALLIEDGYFLKVQLALSSNATTIDVIYSYTISGLVIPMPPIEEQRSILSYLEAESGKFNSLIDKGAEAIALLKERRSALISAAVTGKIDVRGLAA